MNEEESQDHDPAPTHQQPATSERIFVRITLWQTALSVVGVIVAVIALYAALTESAAVRQQTAASVWPYVQFSTTDYDTGSSAQFMLTLDNAGVGPAKLNSMRITIDKEAVQSWQQVVTSLGGSLDAEVRRNYVSNRVLSPGESIEVIGTDDAHLARIFSAAISQSRATVEYCYCSIFDECWFINSEQPASKPLIVDACPDFGTDTFKN